MIVESEFVGGVGGLGGQGRKGSADEKEWIGDGDFGGKTGVQVGPRMEVSAEVVVGVRPEIVIDMGVETGPKGDVGFGGTEEVVQEMSLGIEDGIDLEVDLANEDL